MLTCQSIVVAWTSGGWDQPELRQPSCHRTVVLFAASKEQEGHWRLFLSWYTVYVQYRTVRATCLPNLSPHLKNLNASCDVDGGHAWLRMPWDGGENSDGRGGVPGKDVDGRRQSNSGHWDLGELAGGWRAHARALWASCNQHARNARAKAHEDRFVGLGSAPVIWKCRVDWFLAPTSR